jgi:hypothetical protein
MSIERLSQVVCTSASYWKVRVQVLEDILHGRYSSGSEYDPAVRCCERGDGLLISLWVIILCGLCHLSCGWAAEWLRFVRKASRQEVTTIMVIIIMYPV